MIEFAKDVEQFLLSKYKGEFNVTVTIPSPDRKQYVEVTLQLSTNLTYKLVRDNMDYLYILWIERELREDNKMYSWEQLLSKWLEDVC